MNLGYDLTANYRIGFKYHGWGMPLTLEVVLGNITIFYDEVTRDQTLEGSVSFGRDTPFYLQIGLRDKTYAHTDLIHNRDHEIEIVELKFLDYDLLELAHVSEYLAHRDCERPDAGTMIRTVGSRRLGQNGRWHLGTCHKPFYSWYQDTTHQGQVYQI